MSEVCDQTLRQHGPGQTFSNQERIVAESSKDFAQHFGLLGVLRHAIHFSLQLLGSDRPLPVILQRLRLSFRVAPETLPHRAMAWDQGSALARFGDASKLPQSPADKIRAARMSECEDFPVALRRRKRLRPQTLLRGEKCAYCLTGIRLQPAVYFCLHRGSLPEKPAASHPKFPKIFICQTKSPLCGHEVNGLGPICCDARSNQ